MDPITNIDLPYTILLADDDEDDRLLAQDAMEAAGSKNRCFAVEDGKELLDYLRGEGKYNDIRLATLPSVIILDLNMPILDGRETLKMLKADAMLSGIPVVILSTSSESEDIEDSYRFGASSYMIKPVNFKALVDMMKSFNEYWFSCSTLPIRERNVAQIGQ